MSRIMEYAKRIDAERAERKRFNLWLKNAHDSECAARRNIRDKHPLAAIASINIARLELMKVKQALLRKVGRGGR